MIETPYNFLKGDFGKEFLKEYNERVKIDYGNNPNLHVLKQEGDIVKGSNIFAVVLANKILIPELLRTAVQADLEKILHNGALGYDCNTYCDSGLILRDVKHGPNRYLANKLYEQLKLRNSGINLPILINPYDLNLVKDSDSDYGISFKLAGGANPLYVPALHRHREDFDEDYFYSPAKPDIEVNFNDENIDPKTGLPLPDQTGKGYRTLSATIFGLSRLSSRGRNIYSNIGDLAKSDLEGRIVVVKN